MAHVTALVSKRTLEIRDLDEATLEEDVVNVLKEKLQKFDLDAT